MNALTIRHLLIDMKPPLVRHWNGGEVFLSAFFDALSMSFPVGEQFFIDSLREGMAQLPADQKPAWAREIQGFVGQEATHRRLHELYNQHLAVLGYENRWAPRVVKRLKRLEVFADKRH